MKINAYILAADPAWIEASVLSYYDIVEKIIVSYDQNGLGWTGAPIDTQQCIERVKKIDRANKMTFVPGHFSRINDNAMVCDTFQRQTALDLASKDAEWVLQLDTDEIVQQPERLAEVLERVNAEYVAVDWPMRTFFQRTADGKFLEVCSLFHRTIGSYPGPIAVRAGTKLCNARQTHAPTWRLDFRKKDTDPAAGGRRVDAVIPESTGILHLSWIRTEAEIEAKLRAWGHSHDFDWQRYLQRVWKKAPRQWWRIYHFHPMAGKWWPALRPVDLSAVFRGTQSSCV